MSMVLLDEDDQSKVEKIDQDEHGDDDDDEEDDEEESNDSINGEFVGGTSSNKKSTNSSGNPSGNSSKNSTRNSSISSLVNQPVALHAMSSDHHPAPALSILGGVGLGKPCNLFLGAINIDKALGYAFLELNILANYPICIHIVIVKHELL